MQNSVENSQIPITTVHHQPGSQLTHPNSNLSPINQVSPPNQQIDVSPGTSGNTMTSNLTPPTQLNTFLMRMQQDARLAGHCSEQQQRLLLQHEQETARRLSHIGNIGYGPGLPTIEINRVGKKRKMIASPTQNIKSEPGKDYTDVDQESSTENYRSLPWSEYNKDKWSLILDANCRPLSGFKYTVSADKGFVHSEAHTAFVSQKKNHFQVTVTAYGFNGPKFIRTEGGVTEIRAFYISLYGFKNESKNQTIPINQSTVERQKYSLDPIRVEFHNGSLTKTIPRLHFSATTENNMRKKGKPNPNQRFFSLVVNLEAETITGQKHLVAACISDKIIVRASSPSNFDLEQQLWERVDNTSIRYMGNVGINIDRPEHATLAIGGNVLVSGTLNHYSDNRVKENINLASTSDELEAVKKLNLYNYKFTDEFCDYSNIEDSAEFGVLAQEVQNILPDAVRPNGDVNLSSGKIENLLTVNKDRIYMAGVGAVKELSGITDDIVNKIDELETVNTNLVDRFKRKFGSKSTLNSSIKEGKRGKEKNYLYSSMDSLKSRENIRKSLRMMQGAVCCLSAVVIMCLAAIVCLFVVMHNNANIVSQHIKPKTQAPFVPHKVTDPPKPKNITGGTERQHTVTPRVTYGNTATTKPPPNFFETATCDVSSLPDLASAVYTLQYKNLKDKRLECDYQINLTPEEYFLRTNQNHFKMKITTGNSRVMSEQCRYKTTICSTEGPLLSTSKNDTLPTLSSVKGKQKVIQKKGKEEIYEYMLLSGINKILTRIRLLPDAAACTQCCHVSQGEYLDVHFTFTFNCPNQNNMYKIHNR